MSTLQHATLQQAMSQQAIGQVCCISSKCYTRSATSSKDIVCLQAFDHGPWPRMTGRERGAILYKFADLMEQNTHELAILESLDNGKPLSASK